MINEYKSKYPEIVVDRTVNSPNDNQIVRLTLEQYYDLLHHTHNASDIIGTIDVDEAKLKELNDKLDEAIARVNELQQKVNSVSVQTNNLESNVTTLDTKVQTIDKYVENNGFVIDFDPSKPGIQGPDES